MEFLFLVLDRVRGVPLRCPRGIFVVVCLLVSLWKAGSERVIVTKILVQECHHICQSGAAGHVPCCDCVHLGAHMLKYLIFADGEMHSAQLANLVLVQ